MIRHNYRPHVERRHVNWATLGRRPAAPAPVAPVAPAPAEPEAPDYTTWLKADLVALAEGLGLDSSGTKAEIIERLTDE